MSGRVLIGTCSWTDKSLIDAGTFYPKEVRTPESRLIFYASQFPLVEIDSSYYAIPSVENAERWVERTPQDFLFDIKAYGLFTMHPVQPQTFPRDLLAEMPPQLQAKRVYSKDIPEPVRFALWDRYIEVLRVLDAAGKLGVVLFQFPPWFVIGRDNRAYLEQVRTILAEYQVAVEFRGGKWMDPGNAEKTLDLLRGLDIAYVSVDEPQGFTSSTPPIAAATTRTAIVRYHGRNRSTWENTRGAPSDRFDYYYEQPELEEWVPKVHQLQEQADEVHLLMNTNKGDQGIVNARLMAQVLGEHLPQPTPPQPTLL